MPVIAGTRLAVLIVAFGMASPATGATCTATVPAFSFPAIDILAGNVVNAQATMTITCVTTVLDIGSLGTIPVCPGIDAGTGGATAGVRALKNGTSPLNYRLYQDSGHTIPWGSNADATLGTVPRVNVAVTIPVISGTGGGSATAIVYAQLLGSQTTAPVGHYTSTLGISARYGTITLPLVGGCGVVLGLLPTTATSSFVLSADIDKNCLVTTVPINFNSHGVLSANVDAAGQVRVTCTNPTSYSIGLAVGAFTATTRRMTAGGFFVEYGLYQDSNRTVPWGNVSSDWVNGTGTGLTQNYPVYGRVPPQSTPPANVYNDSVAVTIIY